MVNSPKLNEAIAELHSYRGTIFEEAANDTCKIIKESNINFILNAFEIYESVADRFNSETGCLPYADARYYVDGSGFDLILGVNYTGYGTKMMSRIIDFDHPDQSSFSRCYDEWYHYVVDLNLIKFIKYRLKEALQDDPYAEFDQCLDYVILRLTSHSGGTKLSDETRFREWATSKLLPTYRRNRLK